MEWAGFVAQLASGIMSVVFGTLACLPGFCPGIPELGAFLISFGLVNSSVQVLKFFAPVRGKCASDFFGIAILAVGIWGATLTFPEADRWNNSTRVPGDACEKFLFACGFVSSAIPTAILAVMILYGIALGLWALAMILRGNNKKGNDHIEEAFIADITDECLADIEASNSLDRRYVPDPNRH